MKHPYEVPTDLWECQACSAIVGSQEQHDHFCPGKVQTPIETSPGGFIEAVKYGEPQQDPRVGQIQRF